MSLTLRPAQPSDIPAMAAIRAREWETEPYWVNRISGYLEATESGRAAFFVALDGPNLVGFVAAHRTKRWNCDAELQWINVARESRGQGVAKQLLVQIGKWFVEQNALRVCVDVEPGNAPARALYTSCGAQPVHPYWMIWEDSRTLLSLTK